MSYLSVVSALPGASNVWLLDESSGTSLADSLGALTLTSHVGMTVGATSIVPALAKSVSNSTGYASTASGITATGDFWVAIWFSTITTAAQRFFGSVGGGNKILYIQSNKINLNILGSNMAMATSLNDGNPHLVVLSRTGSTISIFYDANTTADVTATITGSFSQTTLGVGADEAGAAPFAGSLGGIALGIGSGLTGAQSASIYAAGNAGGGPAAPIARNRFLLQAVNRASTY